jgi:glycosyltransferase involved in cell wall biosynthesis
MTFAIITHVPHVIEQKHYFAYGPYVREMNIWNQQADKVVLVAPGSDAAVTSIDLAYDHKNMEWVVVDRFDLLSLKAVFLAVLKVPKIVGQLYSVMKKADHIHLRCPGNVGLLGCFVQLLFPNTPKTAKYAGNWDPKSKQPWSYRLQQRILSTTFLTRNMQVLVYGEWEGMTKNIKPFFTATYTEEDKLPFAQRDLEGKINFVFAGTLVKGKNPLYAIQLVEQLAQKGHAVSLRLYGEGEERKRLEDYILANELESIISLEGNQSKETLKSAYQSSHFVLLPSDSEGWPKAIAEGMFWGCVPIAKAVSCVPFMLDYGNRGVLLEMDLEKDVENVELLLKNQTDFDSKRQYASDWSRNYTLDVFEREIIDLLKQDKKIKN